MEYEQNATSNAENSRYNAEVTLLDGILEFHPEFIDALSEEEQGYLRKYYRLGEETPENIFAYRQELVKRDAKIKTNAELVFHKVCRAMGVEN